MSSAIEKVLRKLYKAMYAVAEVDLHSKKFHLLKHALILVELL